MREVNVWSRHNMKIDGVFSLCVRLLSFLPFPPLHYSIAGIGNGGVGEVTMHTRARVEYCLIVLLAHGTRFSRLSRRRLIECSTLRRSLTLSRYASTSLLRHGETLDSACPDWDLSHLLGYNRLLTAVPLPLVSSRQAFDFKNIELGLRTEPGFVYLWRHFFS